MDGPDDFVGLITVDPERFRDSGWKTAVPGSELTDSEGLWFVFAFFVGGWSLEPDSLR